MLIALDFGKTYSRDPELWNKFIADANARGHEVVCVTLRDLEYAVTMPCKVIYTAGEKKLKYMTKLGRSVDIWIDDWPATIV
jgi:hypothetical protein